MTTLTSSSWSGRCCTETVLKQTSSCSPCSMTVSRSRFSSRLAASCSASSSSVCVTSLGNCVSSSLPHSCRSRVATSLATPENFSSDYIQKTANVRPVEDGRMPPSRAVGLTLESWLPPPRRLCFRPCLSVCLSVCLFVVNFAQKLPCGFA